ncbi:hypothetical protein PIB30_062493, partial [Stylosanthes scabra]|nr:hypothetical protein [Stylosanthes scabra]
VSRLLKLRRGSVIVPPPPVIMSHVRDAGFEGPLMMRDFDVDSPLLSTFVEHWRPESVCATLRRMGRNLYSNSMPDATS